MLLAYIFFLSAILAIISSIGKRPYKRAYEAVPIDYIIQIKYYTLFAAQNFNCLHTENTIPVDFC